MSQPIVFLGPSLPRYVAERILPADYRPPVAQGDVVRALQDQPDALIIIDGFFELVPAVWHKEILLALDRGIPVFGAASMGALRAAELHTYGMIGVGKIFEWFRDGDLTDDDEVAVVNAPPEDGHRSLSVAMVDIRAALADAERAGTVTSDERAQLTALAKGLPYPERLWGAVVYAAELVGAAEAASRLREYAEANGPWQKHRDAVEVLGVVADALRSGDLARPILPEPLARTVFLEMLINDAMQEPLHASSTLDGGVLPALPLPESRAVTEKKVLLRLLVRREAERCGLRVTEEDLQQSADHFRIEHGFLEVKDFHSWFHAAGLHDAAFVRFLEDRCLAEAVQRQVHHEIQRELLDQIRMSSAQPWAEAQRRRR